MENEQVDYGNRTSAGFNHQVHMQQVSQVNASQLA
jgi:hypothetical protein